MTVPVPPHEPLFDIVRSAWTAWDPPPPGLAETILVALAMDDLDAEYELLTLVNRHDQLVGTRSDSQGDRVLIEFRSGELTVLVRVSHDPDGKHRVDGWVTPASGGSVTLLQGEQTTTAALDANGRFDLPASVHGLTRLIVQPAAGSDGTPLGEFRTTLFEI